MPSRRLDPLAYRVLKNLQAHDISQSFGSRWLVACSGGLDSIVLLSVVSSIADRLKIEVEVGHLHHGQGENTEFRNQARHLVGEAAGSRPLHLHELSSAERSEAEMRDARIEFFRDIYTNSGCTSLWLGHHRQDQLETRMINLVRGTGATGLQGMQVLSDLRGLRVVRPFLGIDRRELLDCAKRLSLVWLEDPSNSESRYLRNWMRQEWLPSLEAHRPGAVSALERSLDLIAESLRQLPSFDEVSDPILPRETFKSFDVKDKCNSLRALLQRCRAPSSSRNQILEVIKRLDSPRKELRFEVGGVIWEANPDSIRVKLAKGPTL